MKLTPLDLRKQQFKKVLRGYDPDEVHGFVQKLAQDWEEVLEERRRADERVEQAEMKLRHYEKVELALQEALEAARETARRAEDMAQQKARLIVEEAELRAQRIAQDAEQERYTVRQDLVKLSSRQSEIAARLRAFLLSEMEILAQFQGDDPSGFFKLMAATEGVGEEMPSGPHARLGPAPEPEADTLDPDAAEPAAPFPLGEAVESAEEPVVEPVMERAPSVRPSGRMDEGLPEPEQPSAAHGERDRPAPPVRSEEREEPAAHEQEAERASSPPPASPTVQEPPRGQDPPREQESARPPDEDTAPTPTYRDWLSGLVARPQEPRVTPPPSPAAPAAETERGSLPFGRAFFRSPSSAEVPLAEPPSGSDATQGWSLRSIVTGAREEEPPSVVASDEERERIRRILEDLD